MSKTTAGRSTPHRQDLRSTVRHRRLGHPGRGRDEVLHHHQHRHPGQLTVTKVVVNNRSSGTKPWPTSRSFVDERHLVASGVAEQLQRRQLHREWTTSMPACTTVISGDCGTDG